MSLLSLPAELRLRVYGFLPDLQPGRCEVVTANSRVTPSICRTSQALRRETLPLFACHSLFDIQIDDAGPIGSARISNFLMALTSQSIPLLRRLQISRHWAMPHPVRWEGHSGFYIRLEQRQSRQAFSHSSLVSDSIAAFQPEWASRFVRPMTEGLWEVTTGTYPVARDTRGMRLESVELLADIVKHYLHVLMPMSAAGPPGSELKSSLFKEDVEFLVNAMHVVASHPISTHDVEQRESGRQIRNLTWSRMEQALRALDCKV